jgi:hypothetical protein
MSGTVANNLERSSGTVGAAGSGIIVDSGDPAIDSNPAGGLGTVWSNSTSGETYVCTDATAGTNVWTNVGDGTGDVQPWGFQGAAYGYHFGSGDQDNGSVNKISFTSDGGSTDVASTTQERDTWTGCSGVTYGFVSGGYDGGTTYDIIDKLAYASDSSMSDAGDLIANQRSMGSSNNETYGYNHGGNGNSNVIQRFQMVATTTSDEVGDLDTGGAYPGGNSDVGNSYGFAAGGYNRTAIIDRYQMQASANATDVGDLIEPQASMASISTDAYGYQCGGGEPSASNFIRKYTFGSSVTSTDTGNLTVARFDITGVTSTTYGYCAGGIWPDSNSTIMEKFLLASNSDAEDIGDLATSGGRYNGPCGAQY